MSLRLANELAADLPTEDLERHMAFVASTLRARQTFRSLSDGPDELEARRSPPPLRDTDPAPTPRSRESER